MSKDFDIKWNEVTYNAEKNLIQLTILTLLYVCIYVYIYI